MQKWAWPALGLFVLACFWGFWSYGPFDLDEGLYAVALMEMQERGDWVVPTYRGEPFFEKPILFYWTAWIADLCGADGVVALRLPSILATIGTLALVGLFTRRIGPVMILSVSVLFMGVGRMFMPDPLLVFGMTAALFAFWKSREDERWYIAAGASLAIAVLAKGPMPLVVFGLLGIYCRWRIPWRYTEYEYPNALARWPRPGSLWWRISGVAIFLAIAAPWYILAAARSPEFVDAFLIKQNLGRLTGAGDAMHLGQFWLYIPVVLVGMLPFSLSLVGAWRSREGGLEKYLWAFVWIVFVLFSIAGTKLPHYILPIFPPIAVLIDRYVERNVDQRYWVYGAFSLACILALFKFGLFIENDSPLVVHSLRMALYMLLLGWLGFIALYYFKRGSPALRGFATMAPLACATCVLGPIVYWIQTHASPTNAALAAADCELPIVEYRTGGEKERGKTSHPSMQWWISRNTEVAETFEEVRLRVKRGPITLITRDGRFQEEQERHTLLGRTELMARFGEFEVYSITPIQLPVE